ncbi:MAG: alanine racemase [Caldisericaceae bacterium]
MEFNRPIWIEIDLAKLKENFELIRKIVNNRRIIAVVKADAYGHGACEVSKILEKSGAYALAVASMEEALILRENAINIPILVLGYVDPKTMEIAAELDISLTMFDKSFVKRLKEFRGKKKVKIHLDVDTGMGRLGMFPLEILPVAREISSLPNVSVKGIYTHFSSADSDKEYTAKQLNIFNNVIKQLKEEKLCPEIIHTSNSGAVLNEPESYFNTVRPGILLYGLTPDASNSNFQPILSFKSRVISARNVRKGSSIGYGRTFTTRKDSLLATIPIGYADGLPRSLSNKGEVLIKGRRAPIVGTISMDLTVIDVTGFPYIHPGNEVVIIGSQGSETITATDIANQTGTINYEIVTRIGKRVKRIFKNA